MVILGGLVSEMSDDDILNAARDHVKSAVSWLDILSERYNESSSIHKELKARAKRMQEQLVFPQIVMR